MRHIFRLCVAGFAAAAGVETAMAADLPMPPAATPVVAVPVPDWSGFYVGVNGGAGWAGTRLSGAVPVASPLPPPLITIGYVTVNFTQNLGIFGGHVGYNWQYGAVVTGIEVDGNWASLKREDILFSAGLREDLLIDTLASARGRLGYSWGPDLLVYGTGGFGYGRNKYTSTPLSGSTLHGTSDASDMYGWVLGAGVEYRWSAHVLLRLEYLYYDFDKYHFTVDTASDSLSAQTSVNVVRGGISYKF